MVRSLLLLVLGVLIFFLVQKNDFLKADTDQTSPKMKNISTVYNKLTPEEKRIIVEKGTEAPFSGEYWNHFAEGVYVCRQCGATLYSSDDKFETSCGWPSFDGEIGGAIRRERDADGVRTEILCANCGAHLGHVFKGEGLTSKNIRHCVNSLSMRFIPKADYQLTETAYFAAGCFWGVEYQFQNLPGVIKTEVGYMGGGVESPSYEEVSAGNTGHAEALKIVFRPAVISYKKLVKRFFEIHDPTQIDRQGPDVGEQYRSAIFYSSVEQHEIAEELIKGLKRDGIKIATKLDSAKEFYPAEEYHQSYYVKAGKEPHCINPAGISFDKN